MAAKTKTKKTQTKAKTTTARKITLKKTPKKKMALKKETPRKATAKKKVVKTKARAPRKVAAKRSTKPKERVREKTQTLEPTPFSLKRPGARSGRLSGDLQGLSMTEGADSESVAELLEEGNAFEAEVILGVEDADAEGEVRTHQVPEDDVPEEYLDRD